MTTKTLHVLLLRHGQTDANATGVIQGHSATPLNDLGRRQAELLARRIGEWRPKVECLISSDLARARQTAEPIARACGVELVLDPAWRERGLGIYEGKTVGERETWRLASGDATPPGAESVIAFQQRVADALRRLPGQAEDRTTVAVVTHGGPIRVLLRLFANGHLPLTAGHETVEVDIIPNCGILHLMLDRDRPDSGWRIVCVNDVGHLAGLESTGDAG